MTADITNIGATTQTADIQDKGYSYFDRDLSWLSFNERILMEAGRPEVPVGEKLSFLGIFASNQDEFYRVRMPAILALKHWPEEMAAAPAVENELLGQVRQWIDRLQTRFGVLMAEEILPELAAAGLDFKYKEDLPSVIDPRIQAFFYEQVAAYLKMVWLPEGALEGGSGGGTGKKPLFFPENDRIYLVVFGRKAGVSGMAIIQIPAGSCGRFMAFAAAEDPSRTAVWMLDDIIRMHVHLLAGAAQFEVTGSYSFKLSRDADIDYKDEYAKDIAGFIQKQIGKRNFGLATRLLYDGQMPKSCLEQLRQVLNCPEAALVKGGRYHNLKDLMKFPAPKGCRYEKWPAVRPEFARYTAGRAEASLLEQIEKKDLLISTPYQDYNTVLRFFNDAAIRPDVTHVAVTLYRIASDSRIAHALMTAASNGKQVTVFVELKARFDEQNNLKWAAMMKAAGVRIVYSIWALKVHAKIALVKRKVKDRLHYSGIIATGNFNENTAGIYADHILMTADKDMMADIETLMLFLEKRARPGLYQFFRPKKLLVAGFNLQEVFLAQIRACSAAAKQGIASRITIKLNNLEEETLINALYEASRAGVQIRMMVRSICRLIPGVEGMSENISVFRLVDRYLEHSRVYIFESGERRSMYMGSSDWMNRNIYRRIEVCCPVEDPAIAATIGHIVELQFADQLHLVRLSADLDNEWIRQPGRPVAESEGKNAADLDREAQKETYRYLSAASAAIG